MNCDIRFPADFDRQIEIAFQSMLTLNFAPDFSKWRRKEAY